MLHILDKFSKSVTDSSIYDCSKFRVL